MKKHVFYLLALGLVLLNGCKKEESFELGNTPAQGSLQADVTGDCLPKTVNGVYIAETALIPATNTITIQVNVTRTGVYDIRTDTVNGYYFRGTGTFTTLGANNVTLRSAGTPFVDGTDNFIVSYDGTICDIAIEVLPEGAGGPATFTLVNGGTPPNCASAVVSGVYVKDVAVNISNFVDVTVDVTQIGTYTIRATGGGMVFQKTGAAFTTATTQTVRLQATGTPTTTGPNVITFDAPFASCNFNVDVVTPVTGSLGGAGGSCTPSAINGTYTQNVALTASNFVTVDITTAAVGAYSVTTDTQAGISFAASGTSTGATQSINLMGTGTPNASGPQTFTVTFGSSTCTFSINIVPAAGPAVYTIDCLSVDVNGSYQVGVALTAGNTIDLPITVTTAGTYSAITASVNGMTFSAPAGTLTLASTTIQLTGTGIPTAAASPTSNLVLTSPACTIAITVAPGAPVIDWDFMIGATTYSGSTSDVLFDNTTFPPYTALDYYGFYGATPDLFNVFFADPTGAIWAAGETYNSNVTTLGVNLGYFSFIEPGVLDLEATDPADTPGANIIITITSHNTTTKTVIGTFTGTAYDHLTSTLKTISNGHFKAVYP